MSKNHLQARSHEQSYLLVELESLGLSTIRVNEFNDTSELQNLISAIKENFLKEYLHSREDNKADVQATSV